MGPIRMTLIQIERKAIKECGKPVRRKIDRQGICDRWEHDYTQQMIADVCKCSISTVRKVLREEGYEEVFDIQGTIVRKIWREKRNDITR